MTTHVVVAALFGAALLGVLGAILAIPCAAAIQIGVREWLAYRREETVAEEHRYRADVTQFAVSW
jgi:predicted PurR-regulated permease PerM